MQQYVKPRRRTPYTVQVLTYEYKKYDNLYLAYCPVLDLYGYGLSVDDALRSFRAVAKSFFVYVFHRGTLYSELHRLGWRLDPKTYDFVQPHVDIEWFKKQYCDLQIHHVTVEIIEHDDGHIN